MEILKLGKGYARVEFLEEELQHHGSALAAVASRLSEDVLIEIDEDSYEFDEKRGIYIFDVKLSRRVGV